MESKENFGKNVGWYIALILAIGILFFVGFQKFNERSISTVSREESRVVDTENENRLLKPQHSSPNSSRKYEEVNETTSNDEKIKDYFPTANGEIINHAYYSLSYMEKYEQAEWVCYPLTKQLLMKPNIPRSDWFNKDPDVSSGSAEHFQYKGSGYTRGHLTPAADMSFDKIAMDECFYMSNMSPQLRNFNNGIWRELEEQTRDWTFQNKEVYIVSGPVFNSPVKYFKKQKIAIPDGFFKVILDIEGPEKKGIAFYFPHEISDQPLHNFAMSLDELESKIKIDLFSGFNQGLIEQVESKLDLSRWPTSDARFKLRVNRWNFE